VYLNVIFKCIFMQLVDEQFDKHQYNQSMMIVKLAEGPDRALEIRIKRINFEANG